MVCRSLGLAPCLWTFTCPLRHSRHAVISHYSPSVLPNPRYKCRIGSHALLLNTLTLLISPASRHILVDTPIIVCNLQGRYPTSLPQQCL